MTGLKFKWVFWIFLLTLQLPVVRCNTYEKEAEGKKTIVATLFQEAEAGVLEADKFGKSLATVEKTKNDYESDLKNVKKELNSKKKAAIDKQVDLSTLLSNSKPDLNLSIGAADNAKQLKAKAATDPEATELANEAEKHAKEAHNLATKENHELKQAIESAQKSEKEWEHYATEVNKLESSVSTFANTANDSKATSTEEVTYAADFSKKAKKAQIQADKLIDLGKKLDILSNSIKKNSSSAPPASSPSSISESDKTQASANPSSSTSKESAAASTGTDTSPATGASATTGSPPTTSSPEQEEYLKKKAEFDREMQQLDTDISDANGAKTIIDDKKKERINKHNEVEKTEEEAKKTKTELNNFKNSAEQADTETSKLEQAFKKIKDSHKQHFKEFGTAKQAVEARLQKANETSKHKDEGESLLEEATEMIKQAEENKKALQEKTKTVKTLAEKAKKAYDKLLEEKKTVEQAKLDAFNKLKELQKFKTRTDDELNKMQHAANIEALEMNKKAFESKNTEAIDHAKIAAKAVESAIPKITQEHTKLSESISDATKWVEESGKAENVIKNSLEKAKEFYKKAEKAYEAAEKLEKETVAYQKSVSALKLKAEQLFNDGKKYDAAINTKAANKDDLKKEYEKLKTEVTNEKGRIAESEKAHISFGNETAEDLKAASKAQNEYDSTSQGVIDKLKEVQARKKDSVSVEQEYNSIKGQATNFFQEYEENKLKVEKVIGAMPPPPPIPVSFDPQAEKVHSTLYDSVMEVAAKEGDENRGDNMMENDSPITDPRAVDLTCKNKLPDKKCDDYFKPHNGQASPACKDKALRLKSLNCAKTCNKCSEYRRVIKRKMKRQAKRDKELWVVKRKSRCKDKSPTCTRKIFNCEKKKHMKKLKKNCPHSCGYCLATNATCVDTNASRCAKWKELGFCKKPEYPRAVKWFYCAQTCKMCPLEEKSSEPVPKSHIWS